MNAEIIESMGTDITVANAARVSFQKETTGLGWAGNDDVLVPVLHDRDVKLIKYLAKYKHFSPFGHCFVSFRVTCPIFVSRQLVKHSYLRINEESRRYISSEPELFYPDVWRSKSKDKKQGSDGPLDLEGQNTAIISYTRSVNSAIACYHTLLKTGVAEEQARMCLPLATYTQFIWSGSLDAWAKMCVLRCAEDSQTETRVIANQISRKMEQLYPHSWAALLGKDWYDPNFYIKPHEVTQHLEEVR